MVDIRINRYVKEYQGGIDRKGHDWDDVSEALTKHHDWTEEGAQHLVHLVRGYGSFILSHALALAVVLNQDDGEIGL